MEAAGDPPLARRRPRRNMKRGIACLLAALAFSATSFPGRAMAATPVTKNQTFLGAQAALAFPGGVPKCDTTTKSVDVLTMPVSILAPTSAATQLTWKPTGSQTSAYRISVIDPSGGTAVTWTIGADSTTQVTYFATNAPSGAWSFREDGLPSSICTGGVLVGSPGTASGTAGWYQ